MFRYYFDMISNYVSEEFQNICRENIGLYELYHNTKKKHKYTFFGFSDFSPYKYYINTRKKC